MLFLGLLADASRVGALTATPSTTEGPYYTLSTANTVTTPGNSSYDGHFFTAEGADNDLTHITSASAQCAGMLFLLSGTLVNTAGAAVSGATVELWEADNNGVYNYQSSSSGTNNYAGRDKLFQGFGKTTTDGSGTWNFRTIKPGKYVGRVRHFHFKVKVGTTEPLTSQFVFSEDKFQLSSDGVVSPLVSNGTIGLVTLTPTTGTDSSGATAQIASKQIVVNYTVSASSAPTITTQPTSQTVAVGGSATFSVVATGSGTLSYQRFKGYTAVGGATGASYTMSSATTDDAGSYDAVVTNSVGSVTSSTATLTVNAANTAHPAFFSGEAALSNGVYYLTFPNGTPFGYYSYNSYPHLYHFDAGFVYFTESGDSASGAYLYDFTGKAWWYTSPAVWPYLYDFGLNAWLYYYPNASDATHYTTNPRYFYNFGTKAIITK